MIKAQIKSLVCVKSVPDLDQVSAGDWKYGEHLPEPEISYVNKIINSYDQNALELLLRLKDDYKGNGLEMKVDVLTIGDAKSVKILKDCCASGADSCVLVEHGVDYKYQYQAVAAILNAYAGLYGQYDIIMCGESAGPYDNGQTAFALSYTMNIPCISDVQRLEIAEEGIKVVCKRDEEICQLLLKKPFIGTADSIRGLSLRLPTLKERLMSSKKNIEILTLKDLGLKEEVISKKGGKLLEKFFALETVKDCHYVDVENLPHTIEQLIEMAQGQRKGCSK